MSRMGLLKASGARLQRRAAATPLSTYQVGQRTVQLFQLANGHIQWVGRDDMYAYYLCPICGGRTKLRIPAKNERKFDPANKSRGWGDRRPV